MLDTIKLNQMVEKEFFVMLILIVYLIFLEFCINNIPDFEYKFKTLHCSGFIIDNHGTYVVAFIYSLVIISITTAWVLMCHFILEKRGGKVIND